MPQNICFRMHDYQNKLNYFNQSSLWATQRKTWFESKINRGEKVQRTWKSSLFDWTPDGGGQEWKSLSFTVAHSHIQSLHSLRNCLLSFQCVSFLRVSHTFVFSGM